MHRLDHGGRTALTERADLLNQVVTGNQRLTRLQLIEHLRQAVMATLQQVTQRSRIVVTTVDQPFVKRLQLVTEITDRTNRRHPRTALEGVQVALQRRQRQGVVGLAQPALQGLAGALEDIHRLFEEDFHHFLIEVGLDGIETRFQLGLGLGLGNAVLRLLERDKLQRRLLRLRQRLAVLQRGGGLVQLDDLEAFRARGKQRQGRRVDGFGKQVAQRLYALGLGADLQRGSDLIHHADQRFMGLFRLVEEALADRQTALFDGAVEVQQSLAQLVDLRQLGHLGATAEGGQFLQQRGQFLALGRMLAPFAQQVLGVQQDVHAFGEEDADQLRVTAFAVLRHALVFEVGEPLLMQRLDAGEELAGAGDGSQRLAFQILQTGAEQPLGAAEQLGSGQVHLNQVGLELLDQLLQRRGNFRHRQDAGHVSAALERMQGALQVIGHRLRQFLRAVGEKAHQGVQMGFRFVAEDLQQLRVEGLTLEGFAIEGHLLVRTDIGEFVDETFALLDGSGSLGNARGLGYLLGGRGVRFWGRQALGQGMRGGGQQVDIVALALRLGGELFDQRRHQRHHVEHHLLHRLACSDAAIQHAIEQVLDGPGQLADDQRTHHAPAALEGVEGATDFDQRVLVVGIGLPLRQVFGDGFQHLANFLDKDFQQLFIHRLFVRRRRQQARRHIGGRRVDRLHRRGHHVSHRQRLLCGRRLDLGLGGAGQFDFRQFQIRQLKLVPLRRRSQLIQAQFFEFQRRLGLGIEQGCGNDLFAL